MFDPVIARTIRVLVLDVDGVLTAGDTWIGETNGSPIELKRYHIQDGLGFRLLRTSRIDVVWVTGRESPSTTLRARELGVEHVFVVDAAAKVRTLEPWLRERGVPWSAVAAVGDDLPDLGMLQRAGLPIAVANARDQIKAVSQYVTRAAGGAGAVREVIDLLLQARGEFEGALAEFDSGASRS